MNLNNNKTKTKKNNKNKTKKTSTRGHRTKTAPLSVSTTTTRRPEKIFTLSRREIVCDVRGTAEFKCAKFELDAVKESTFKWLSELSQGFDQYRFDSITIEYKPSSSALRDGQFAMAVDSNPNRQEVNSENDFDNLSPNARSNVWKPLTVKVTKNGRFRLGEWFYTTSGNTRDGDLRWEMPGSFYYATLGVAKNEDNTYPIIGKVYIAYDVSLRSPKEFVHKGEGCYVYEQDTNIPLTQSAPINPVINTFTKLAPSNLSATKLLKADTSYSTGGETNKGLFEVIKPFMGIIQIGLEALSGLVVSEDGTKVITDYISGSVAIDGPSTVALNNVLPGYKFKDYLNPIQDNRLWVINWANSDQAPPVEQWKTKASLSLFGDLYEGERFCFMPLSSQGQMKMKLNPNPGLAVAPHFQMGPNKQLYDDYKDFVDEYDFTDHLQCVVAGEDYLRQLAKNKKIKVPYHWVHPMMFPVLTSKPSEAVAKAKKLLAMKW